MKLKQTFEMLGETKAIQLQRVEEVSNKTSCLQTSKKILKKKQKFAHPQGKHEEKSLAIVFNWKLYSFFTVSWLVFFHPFSTHLLTSMKCFLHQNFFKKGISIPFEVHYLFENLLKGAYKSCPNLADSIKPFWHDASKHDSSYTHRNTAVLFLQHEFPFLSSRLPL